MNNLSNLINMGNYSFYIWSAFSIVLGSMGLYTWWSIKRYKLLENQLVNRENKDDDANTKKAS